MNARRDTTGLGSGCSGPSCGGSVKPAKIYALTPRFASGRIIRWSVGISRRGERFHKEFSVSTYGGIEEAQAAAIAFRDEVLQRIPALSLRVFSAIVRTNNTSGVPGVYRRVEGHHTRWCAVVHLPDGRSRKRSFAVVKHGEERARQLAIEARLELLKQLDGWLAKHPDARPGHQAPPPIDSCTMPRRPKRSADQIAPRLSAEKRVYRMRWQRKLCDGRTWSRDYWIAEYSVSKGQVRRRGFAVERYGEDEARRLAYAQRQEWIANPPPSSRRSAASNFAASSGK
ncbi:AP2 domain-containing protein [Paracidovorax avenae]|nr:AP2 domain-containing protein [Paracidovorax avenae]